MNKTIDLLTTKYLKKLIVSYNAGADSYGNLTTTKQQQTLKGHIVRK